MLNDPYHRLQSLSEVEVAVRLGLVVDVNRASVDDWLRLPGISIRQARSLVSLTRAGVQFYCLEDVAGAIGAPVEQLQTLAPALRFCFYDPDGAELPVRLDPNLASSEELANLPGVDSNLAQAITHNRGQHGPYRDLADLQQRLHLPPKLTATLLHHIQF
ncbi:ComEA family DNA-binding protein [Leptolyngbya sp. FACHB-261]|nr:ComEA family DNA-binding protein [Leptolyngbya sp. FACHB-261]